GEAGDPPAESTWSRASRRLHVVNPGHRAAGDPACRPRCLEIESAGDAVDVEQFAGEVKTGTDAAFHRFEIDLAQAHAAARHKFILVQAFARDAEFGARELRRQRAFGGAGESGPSRV